MTQVENEAGDEGSTARDLARRQQEINRAEHMFKQFMNGEFLDQPEWFAVTYQARDAKSGIHTVMKRDGSIMTAHARSLPESVVRGTPLLAFCPPTSPHALLFMQL